MAAGLHWVSATQWGRQAHGNRFVTWRDTGTSTVVAQWCSACVCVAVHAPVLVLGASGGWLAWLEEAGGSGRAAVLIRARTLVNQALHETVKELPLGLERKGVQELYGCFLFTPIFHHTPQQLPSCVRPSRDRVRAGTRGTLFTNSCNLT